LTKIGQGLFVEQKMILKIIALNGKVHQTLRDSIEQIIMRSLKNRRAAATKAKIAISHILLPNIAHFER